MAESLRKIGASFRDSGPSNAYAFVSASGARIMRFSSSVDYEDLGADYFVERDAEAARRRAVRQLERLGHKVILEPAA
jgi:hypothetical protein